jgi:hypothetical protein
MTKAMRLFSKAGAGVLALGIAGLAMGSAFAAGPWYNYQINVPGGGGVNTTVGHPVSQPGVVNIDSGPQGGATYNYRVLKTSTNQALMNWEAVAPNSSYTFYPSSVSGEDVSLQIGSPPYYTSSYVVSGQWQP